MLYPVQVTDNLQQGSTFVEINSEQEGWSRDGTTIGDAERN